MSDSQAKLRLDKWLWYARFFKTRTLAGRQISEGHVRLNGARVGKTSQTVCPGDTLTFPQSRQVRVVRVISLGTRRGPAQEAQMLYQDLTPPEAPKPARVGPRPTKRYRRVLDVLRDPGKD